MNKTTPNNHWEFIKYCLFSKFHLTFHWKDSEENHSCSVGLIKYDMSKYYYVHILRIVICLQKELFY